MFAFVNERWREIQLFEKNILWVGYRDMRKFHPRKGVRTIRTIAVKHGRNMAPYRWVSDGDSSVIASLTVEFLCQGKEGEQKGVEL